MMRFNVEDMLAFPQMKQGKFLKNIAEGDIKQAVQEICNIMHYKAEAKKIDVQT